MSMNKKSQVSQVLVDSFTATPGTSKLVNFNGLQVSRGGLRGYVLGIHVLVSGLAKESSAAAVASYLLMWKLVASMTLRAKGHTFFDALPGNVLTVLNIMWEIVRPANSDAFKLADLASSASDVAIGHNFFIPLAPGYYRQGYKHQETDGMYPCAAFSDSGELSINFAAATILGGNWGITGDLTVKVVADVMWTHKAYLPGPLVIEHQDNANSRVELPKTPGKFETVIVMDDALAAYTLPTSAVSVECDGVKIIESLTGADLVKLKSVGREDGMQDVFTNRVLPIVLPTDTGSKFRQVSGSPFVLENCNISHAGANKYVSAKYITMPGNQAAELLLLLGVAGGAIGNAGGYKVAGQSIMSRNKSAAEKLGATLSIDE